MKWKAEIARGADLGSFFMMSQVTIGRVERLPALCSAP